MIAWLARLMSTQILRSPSGFGTTTSGETQLVGPSGTSAVIPQASNLSNFYPTFSLTPNGILRTGCATGFLEVLTLRFNS